jgi:hypothetical protein
MSDFGETTSLEKQSLEAHVDLCAIRYGQLDIRLTGLEKKVDDIQKDILEGQKSLKTTIITGAVTISVALISLAGTLLVKLS